MLLAVVALLGGLAVGLLLGGRFDRLGGLVLRRRRLLVAALVAQLLGGLGGGPFYPAGLALSAVLAAGFLLANRQVRGIGLVALGLLSNALVVSLNGAMPVSAAALDRAGLSSQDLLTGADARHELAGPQTRLRALGDVLPVLLPGRPEVVSAGDVLVAAGLAQVVVVAMCDPGGRSEEVAMAKKGRKKRARKKSAANHGKRPNA